MGGEPDEDCDPQYAMLSANASNGQLHVKTEVAFDEKVFAHERTDGFSSHLRTGQLDALIDMNSGEIRWMMAGE